MSPSRISLLPSPSALASYGISANGFLPADVPLERLPHRYYEPWEKIVKQLPKLLASLEVRRHIDALPVLDTFRLSSEQEWQRAYSMLAIMSQAYVWQGPEPSEVSLHHFTVESSLTDMCTAAPSSDSRALPRCCCASRSTSHRHICSLESLELPQDQGGRRSVSAR